MSAEITPSRKRSPEEMLTSEQVKRAKGHLIAFAHEALANAEVSTSKLLDRTTVEVQLPTIHHPNALYDLNTVMPGIVARLISELENLDFTTVDEYGTKRVAPKDYFNTLLNGVTQLENIHRTYTRGRGAVPGFEQNFNARISPFLTSLSEVTKQARVKSESRKLEHYDSSSQKLTEMSHELQAFKGRLGYHDWSTSATTDVLKALTNVYNIPNVERFASSKERSCIEFLASLYKKVFV